jgi:hypothetical protein
MKIKDLIQRLRDKLRFKPWFFCLLVLIVVITFLIIEQVVGLIVVSVEKKYYEVSPLDERAVYDSAHRDLKQDFSLLLTPQPSYLNGADIKQNLSMGQAAAVVIENYTPIRHLQEGLEGAAIVYEAPTEGGITRFLAIYAGDPVDTIGPVRSARPYFITWASEYLAGFAHVGGSYDALENLKTNFRVLNIDEFSDSSTIWRNNDYSAPHNAYTSTGNILLRLNKEKYSHPVTEKRFPFKNPDSSSGDIKTIDINFSIDPYEVKYIYDDSTKTYTRYNGGALHHNIKPADVLVQFVDTEVLDDAGRLRIQTNGTGKALVFRDGKVIEGTWEKDSSINSPDQSMSESWTKFFDKDGKEIELNKGQIWIEVVPKGNAVNYF